MHSFAKLEKNTELGFVVRKDWCIFVAEMGESKQKKTAQDVFAEYLAQRKLRRTSERMFILEKALTMKKHFTADQLHASVECDGYHVSRATVYNTLDHLLESGLVIRLRFADGTSHFEMAENASGHLHLVCTRCGKVSEVRDAELMRMLAVRRYRSFQARHFDLTVNGVCSKCRRAVAQSRT